MAPFYEEWWFLVVIALVGLIFILLLVFILIIRGQSKKYTKKADSGRATRPSALTDPPGNLTQQVPTLPLHNTFAENLYHSKDKYRSICLDRKSVV